MSDNTKAVPVPLHAAGEELYDVPTSKAIDEALGWLRDARPDYHATLTRIISHLEASCDCPCPSPAVSQAAPDTTTSRFVTVTSDSQATPEPDSQDNAYRSFADSEAMPESVSPASTQAPSVSIKDENIDTGSAPEMPGGVYLRVQAARNGVAAAKHVGHRPWPGEVAIVWLADRVAELERELTTAKGVIE